MATKKMVDMVNKDRRLAILFGGMVFDGIVIIVLVVAALWVIL